MRKIITTTFIILDGVMQAPGGPDEDKSGGFGYGARLVSRSPGRPNGQNYVWMASTAI